MRIKRAFDVIVATILFVAFLPVGLVVALVLRLTGEGQVIFSQRRPGRNGKSFALLKFATMRRDAAGSKIPLTGAGDPRVLPVGRWLRKTKLDELPQLLNVLKGDMSLVGPRPLPPEVFTSYPPTVQERLLEVRPGVTGLGSIAFRDEERIFARSRRSTAECYREEIAPRKGRLEMWYIENWSLGLDLKLLLLTVVALLAPWSRPLQLLVVEELSL